MERPFELAEILITLNIIEYLFLAFVGGLFCLDFSPTVTTASVIILMVCYSLIFNLNSLVPSCPILAVDTESYSS